MKASHVLFIVGLVVGLVGVAIALYGLLTGNWQVLAAGTAIAGLPIGVALRDTYNDYRRLQALEKQIKARAVVGQSEPATELAELYKTATQKQRDAMLAYARQLVKPAPALAYPPR